MLALSFGMIIACYTDAQNESFTRRVDKEKDCSGNHTKGVQRRT